MPAKKADGVGANAGAALGRDKGVPGTFPTRVVAVLVLAMITNSYTLVSLFPYSGVMVKMLLGLQTTNEAGESRCGTVGAR